MTDPVVIVSVRWTLERDRYITFWRANDSGYAFPLPWTGRYDREAVLEKQRYYNNGEDTIAVPLSVVESLASPVDKGMVDNDAGPIVRNTLQNWVSLMDAVIAPPLKTPRPKWMRLRNRLGRFITKGRQFAPELQQQGEA